MGQRNLFTLNSKKTSWHRGKPLIFLIVWTALTLAAVDVFINVVFAYPQDPKFMHPSQFQLYFEYGRSVEGKLRRMTRPNRAETAPITLTGWYHPLEIGEAASRSNGPIVTFYGESNTVNLARALGRTSDRFSLRIVGAPGATGNWAYGAYLQDRGGGKSRAVVLGFAAMNLAMISSFSPMIWSPDDPIPYTADRFYLDGGQLKAIQAPYHSFDQYVTTFYNPAKWSAALAFFAKNDPFYDRFVMNANVLDHSSLSRLFRRVYGQQQVRDLQKAALDESGFHPDSEQVRVARAIIHKFALQARSDGMVPVVYIINNLGYSDYLLRALRPALAADDISYLSSNTIVSPYDVRDYLPDSHFTEEENNRLAAALVEVIEHAR